MQIEAQADQIRQYRNDLEIGILRGPENERSLYNIHLETLAELERSLEGQESVEAIAEQVTRIRHAHGWSYLSGDVGAEVTTSAHKLLSDIEEQIFKKKGREWYYDAKWRKD